MRKGPVKTAAMEAYLRGQIVGGRWKPGHQIPTRAELQQKFKVMPPTIQVVIRRLTEDGFLFSRSTNGTFVAENLPHLHRYGFYCTGDWVHGARRSLYWVALQRAAREFSTPGQHEIVLYEHSNNPQKHQLALSSLLADINAQRLAGLIVGQWLPQSATEALANHPEIKCVALSQKTTPVAWPAVELGPSWIEAVLKMLAEKGRKRVAYISEMGLNYNALLERSAKAGFKTLPQWIFGLHSGEQHAIRNVTHLLMSAPPKERPDALLVTDDNVLDGVVAGLIAARVRVPDDVDVIAHANFPEVTPCPLPVVRVGYDARRVIRTCIELIDQLKRNVSVPDKTEIPAVFDSELALESSTFAPASDHPQGEPFDRIYRHEKN